MAMSMRPRPRQKWGRTSKPFFSHSLKTSRDCQCTKRRSTGNTVPQPAVRAKFYCLFSRLWMWQSAAGACVSTPHRRRIRFHCLPQRSPDCSRRAPGWRWWRWCWCQWRGWCRTATRRQCSGCWICRTLDTSWASLTTCGNTQWTTFSRLWKERESEYPEKFCNSTSTNEMQIYIYIYKY